MYISEDIIKIYKKNLVLIYNYNLNKISLLNKSWYKSKIENKKNIETKDFSEKEMEYLKNNGIIIDDFSDYYNRYYSLIVKNRDTSTDINTIYFHVTQRCNLKCEYCYNSNNLNKKDVLSTNEILKVIDKFQLLNPRKVIITGGEALLRKDICQIIEYIKSKGMVCELLTNGMLLDKNLDVLKILDYVVVSLDTLVESDNIRTGLNINRVVKTLQNIDSDLKKKIAVRSVIGKFNENSWKTIKIFCEKNNYKHISSIYIPNNSYEIKNQPNMNNIELDTSIITFSGNACGAGYKEIAIDYNGDIYPCQALVNKKFLITNIMHKNWIEEIHNSKIVNIFKKINVDEIKECKDCKIRYLCGGGCRAVAYNIDSNLLNKSSYLCKYLKRIVYQKLINIFNLIEG